MGHGQHQGGSLGLRHEQPMTLAGMQDYIYILGIYIYTYILGILYVMVFFSDFHIIGIFLDLLRSSLLNMNADMNACACIDIVHYDRVHGILPFVIFVAGFGATLKAGHRRNICADPSG
jgi:hypothetical protein